MINYFKHNSDSTDNIKTLSNFLKEGNCIYQIIGKAEHSQNVNSKLYNILRKYINDPTKIYLIKKNDALNTAKSITKIKNSNKKMYFTSCIFCLSGKKCYNEKANRTFNFNFNTKKGNKSIKVCYPDISKCRNRITLGMHINFTFTYNGRYLEVVDVNPLIDNTKKTNVITNNNESNLDSSNFPSLDSIIIDNKEKIIDISNKPVSNIDSNSSTIAIDNDHDLTAKQILCKNIDSDDSDDIIHKLITKTAPKIIVPSELTKKLNFTIDHINNERAILKMSFLQLEKETMNKVVDYDDELYIRYDGKVNNDDFRYSIS